jgi:UDP-N-acetylmuramate dehydrogenase
MPTAALQKRLGERLLKDESLARYTAARLGGSADWLYVARDSVDELAEVVSEAWAEGVPVRLLGGGANVLISDKGIRGLTVINKVSEVTFGDWHDGRSACATSGTALTTLANRCQAQGLTGMEWAVAVPGTVGGAIVNNAGAHGMDTAQSVADVVVLEAGRGPKLYTTADLDYGYRHSMLKARENRDYLVLLATFTLAKDDPAAIRERMTEFNNYRKETQPPGASLGSIFKNPDGDYAGRLIEAAGLKGHRIGNAMVSPVHANFFINVQDSATPASADDYRALIDDVREKVAADSGVELALEIELVGEWN